MTIDPHAEVAGQLAAALAGKVADPAAIVADLDLAKLLDADGRPDPAKVDAVAGRFATALGSSPAARRPDLGQGRRGGPADAGTARERASAEAARRFGPKPGGAA